MTKISKANLLSLPHQKAVWSTSSFPLFFPFLYNFLYSNCKFLFMLVLLIISYVTCKVLDGVDRINVYRKKNDMYMVNPMAWVGGMAL